MTDSTRRRVLQTGAVGLAASAGCIAGEFPPSGAGTGGGGFGNGGTVSNPTNAKEDLQWWAAQPTGGEEGRPFPIAGAWNIGATYNVRWEKGPRHGWSPNHFTDLIEEGSHVYPTYKDPINEAVRYNGRWDGVDVEQLITEQWRGMSDGQFQPTALDYCAEHSLPIAFRGWNYGGYLKRLETSGKYEGKEWSVDETGRVVQNGKPQKPNSPIGPIERWRELARTWFDNPLVKALADRYPDPPRITFLDNNEFGIIGPGTIGGNSTRFVEEYPDITGWSTERKLELIHKGYKERYQALYDEAKKVAPRGWGEALEFVAYNSLPWPKLEKGNAMWTKEKPSAALPKNAEWSWHDGTMPETYLNDWQIGKKQDFGYWSPQHEAAAQAPLGEYAVNQDKDYFLSRIMWEGGSPPRYGSSPNKIARGKWASKRDWPGSIGVRELQQWDPERFAGMAQFALWCDRPRSFRLFRGGAALDAYHQAVWKDAVLDPVDRVWEAPETLKEFWKHGELVELDPPSGWKGASWVKNWYLLPCAANPSGEELHKNIATKWKPDAIAEFRVKAFALVRGEEPNRKWMIYAHAPLGAVSDTTVTVPAYGEVEIPEVSRTGSFYVVREGEDTVEQAIRGGPSRITVTADAEQVAPGESVTVTAEATVTPEGGFDSFEWDLGDAGTQTTNGPGSKTVSFENEGLQMIRVTGSAGDETVVDDVGVYVGNDFGAPYDVELSAASAWDGPWDAVGGSGDWPGELRNYRLVPNAAADEAAMPLIGGQVVDDAERGEVVELSRREGVRDDHLQTVGLTSGAKNQTVHLEFKVPDAGKNHMLYAEGGKGDVGYNMYIYDGTLYGGVLAEARSDSLDFSGVANPDETGLQNSYFLSGGTIESGTWHSARLVVDGAKSGTVTDGVVSLYLDGERVDQGPGAQFPDYGFTHPVVGAAISSETHAEWPGGLAGRLARFRYLLSADHP